jgi:hypothetical protein
LRRRGSTAQLPWREAIIEVLRDAGAATHYTDIADQIVAKKLRKDVGATPARTANYFIATSINREGGSSPFVRAAVCEYMLSAEYGPGAHPTTSEVDESEVGPPETEQRLIEPTGIIHAFGMYWLRENVVRSQTPKLLGEQAPGAAPVDFSGQRGVYLLHDGREVVYVGMAADQTLGRRLYQHTIDRLNSRWNRFSWFGILRVRTEGQLAKEDLSSISVEDLIATMEALLIEGLEPRQNRRRGDEFRASEYLQVKDPRLRKRELADLMAVIQSQMMQE